VFPRYFLIKIPGMESLNKYGAKSFFSGPNAGMTGFHIYIIQKSD
jgi:hypothetical protein